MDFYLSLATCKQLKHWGCQLYSNNAYGFCGDEFDIYTKTKHGGVINSLGERVNASLYIHGIKSYHILEDVCVKYKEEFFGKNYNRRIYESTGEPVYLRDYTEKILYLLQEGNKKKAEEYLLKNTIFNPANK